MINVFQPSLGEQELAAVKEVFDSNWVGKGKKTDQFEQDFANYIGADRDLVRSISNCTEGLFQAMKLLNIKAGDEVILPTISFVGAANAIVACGASPIFCDVDSKSLNATADTIRPHITSRTKAIILLHYGGVPCEMDGILELKRKHAFYLIEDSACSVASSYRGQACGTFGDVGVWSFDAMKVLVTGTGGMVYCRTPEMVKQLDKEIYFGLTSESGISSPLQSRWWEFDVTTPGRRAIINDITAAIGVVQLKKLERMVESRRIIHDTYNRELVDGSVALPLVIPDHIKSTYYFYWVQTQRRDELATFLRECGIYTTFRYYPLHRVPFYRTGSEFPGADLAADTTLCLPIHPSLSWYDVAKVITMIKEFTS